MTYAETNDFARRVCGLPPSERFPVVKRITEQEWIEADLRDKVADKDAAALADQIKHQELES